MHECGGSQNGKEEGGWVKRLASSGRGAFFEGSGGAEALILGASTEAIFEKTEVAEAAPSTTAKTPEAAIEVAAVCVLPHSGR